MSDSKEDDIKILEFCIPLEASKFCLVSKSQETNFFYRNCLDKGFIFESRVLILS